MRRMSNRNGSRARKYVRSLDMDVINNAAVYPVQSKLNSVKVTEGVENSGGSGTKEEPAVEE